MTRPGYKITEIGEIPEEWVTRKFHEILATVKGKPPNTLLDYDESEKLLPYLSAEYLRGHYEKAKYCFIEDDKRITTVDVDDIIVIWDGNAGEFFSGMKGILSSTMAKLIFKDERISREFIYYFLKKCEGKLKNTTKGSTIPHLDGNILSNLDILLPTLQEQQKIAEILTTAEDAIQKVNEQITLTEQLKKGLMQKLLTKGIGHTKFKKTEIGEIPEEWDVNKISDLKQSMYYGVTAKATEKDTNLRLLRTTDIENFKFNSENLPFCEITEKKSDLSKYYLKKDDVIVARAGTVGISVLVKDDLDNTLFGSYLIKIVFKHEKVDMKFIHYYFQSQLYWNNLSSAQGSTIKNINLPFLNSLVVPLPNVPEQQKIAKILNTADRKLELLRNKKEQAEHMKKGLMQSLLTGQVRVKINSIKGDN